MFKLRPLVVACLGLTVSLSSLANVEPYYGHRDGYDTFKGLKIQSFSDGKTLTVAYHTPDAGIQVGDYNFSGNHWQAARYFNIPKPLALDFAAGVAKSPAGDLYVFTTVDEAYNATRERYMGYRDNVLRVLNIPAGTSTASLFANLNSPDYLDDWSLHTPQTRGKARMRFADGVLGMVTSHWWYFQNGDGLSHQRAVRFALDPASKQEIFRDNQGHGPNWHTGDSVLMIAGDHLFTADTTEAGVTLKRYGINNAEEKGMQAHRIVYSTPAQDGMNIELAGIAGREGNIMIAFSYNDDLISIAVPRDFPTYPDTPNGFSEVYDVSSSVRTWGTAGKMKKYPRLAALNDHESMLLWEEWDTCNAYAQTGAIRVGNSGGNGPFTRIDSAENPLVRLNNASDAFMLTADDGKNYVAWTTKAPGASMPYVFTVEDLPIEKVFGAVSSALLNGQQSEGMPLPATHFMRGENRDLDDSDPNKYSNTFPAEQRFVHGFVPSGMGLKTKLHLPNGEEWNAFNPIFDCVDEYVVHLWDIPEEKRQGLYTLDLMAGGLLVGHAYFTVGTATAENSVNFGKDGETQIIGTGGAGNGSAGNNIGNGNTDGNNTGNNSSDPDWARVMNWAESLFANFFPTQGKQSLEFPPYQLRYYPSNGTYLGYNTADGRFYGFNPQMWGPDIVPFGVLSEYLPGATQAGF